MQDVDLLVRAGCSGDVVAHCIAVAKTAVSIAERVPFPIDRDLVRLGGLFHDIGRARTHGIGHAIAGVEIGRSMGFPEPLLRIIERHIGAGITAPEARRLGLPEKDYLPLTPEEKIVSYADNLTKGSTPMSIADAVERFREILGPGHEGIGLLIRQHEEIRGWMR
jgi:uncharacterized protein